MCSTVGALSKLKWLSLGKQLLDTQRNVKTQTDESVFHSIPIVCSLAVTMRELNTDSRTSFRYAPQKQVYDGRNGKRRGNM